MLDPSFADHLDELLSGDDADRVARYPGLPAGRQPVHTCYVPADRYGTHTVDEWRAVAIGVLDQHGPLPSVLVAQTERVRDKLASEPIEDLRIDFEDGYGLRPDDTEDQHARAAAVALARSATANATTAFSGIRMKSLEAPTRRRGLRTLELFLESLVANTSVPAGFRVTLPKVTSVRQIEAMVEICAALESRYGIAPLRFEIQIETPQAVLGADGTALLARMIHACLGRCAGLHYGTYDYSAALGIAAAYQSMEHPGADHAKAVMQVAAAGTGVPICDGSTNVLPVGGQVRAAWELHARLVRRSLERGFYQGWDLHPAQLPTRFAATFAFYRDGLAAAGARLRAYRERADSGVLDEPATERALAGYLLRGLDAGAVDAAELQAAAGVTASELSVLVGRAPR